MTTQLFFTTHNLDILDLLLCKHSFNFLKKDDSGISMVNIATYLKKSTDEFRNEVVPKFLLVNKMKRSSP